MIKDKDREYVWHPFTHQKNLENIIPIIKGEGIYLYAEDGSRYIDAISSWWVNLHGHCNPYISKKLSEQLFKLEHAIFSGFTHEPAVNLAERIFGYLPQNYSKVFFSDDGSTSVEVALKMCLQYWHNKGQAKKTFIALEGAYHGDTFGGMSVGERNVFSNAFSNLLFDVQFIPLPNQNNIGEVKDNFLKIIRSYDVAGFIFEPLVQGASGMRMYDALFLDELIQIANENKIITIADEVMTGFYRTGKFFASDYLKNKPDIICLSKGLTAGYMPLGVTACADFIYQEFVDDDKRKTFFHGHSYTANPLACTAALASLDLLEKDETLSRINLISQEHLKFKDKISELNCFKDVRALGTIIAFEVQTRNATEYLNSLSEDIYSYFIKRGLILRPLGNIFYILPPYVILVEELRSIYSAIESFGKELEKV